MLLLYKCLRKRLDFSFFRDFEATRRLIIFEGFSSSYNFIGFFVVDFVYKVLTRVTPISRYDYDRNIIFR